MCKESNGGQLSENEVVDVLRNRVKGGWTGTHWSIFRDLKSRFEDENVKDEVKEIRKEIKEFYNKNHNVHEYRYIPKKIIELTISVCSMILVDKEPPNERPETLEGICRDIVERRARTNAEAMIDHHDHLIIASGVIVDD